MTSKNIDKTNAVFKINNRQTYSEQTESIEVTTEGQFYVKNKSYFLIYKEYTEFGDVSVLIRAAKDKVVIKKSGACNVRMEYEPDTKREVRYSVPIGDIIIELETQSISVVLDKSGGNIKLKYNLIVNEEKYSNVISIDIAVCDKQI